MGRLTLDSIRDVGSGESYPQELLKDQGSALVLFAAGFYGRQDAYWIAEAGMTADCVDTDESRLHEMSLVYPVGWRYTVMDAFDFASATEEQWDVVSLDPPTNLFDECAQWLGLWCQRARKAVVLGTGHDTVVRPPHGWRVTDVRPRSSFKGGVDWTVLERA